MTLNEKQQSLCSESKWDFSDLRAIFLNCTLKKSPEMSHTQGLVEIAKAIMEKNRVTVDELRPVDFDIATGVWPQVLAAVAEEPILPGPAVVRQPIIDLQFDDHRGLAQWWLPELLLLGNTDEQVATQGPAHWKSTDDTWSYDRVSSDGRLSVAVTVERIEPGWMATLTIGNLSETIWSNVVAPVCLLLHASGAFQDPRWKRTYYRSEGQFLTYEGRETDGGRDLFRMSLVQRQRMLVRSDDHRQKWGFTKQLSEDGIIAVVSQDGSTVLTTTWIPTHHLQANRRRTYSCIHANPHFGRVGPGESRTCRGYVLLNEGNLEQAWNETNRVVMEHLE